MAEAKNMSKRILNVQKIFNLNIKAQEFKEKDL